MLDVPLERGREPGHYVCRVVVPSQPEDARILAADAALVGGLGLAVACAFSALRR